MKYLLNKNSNILIKKHSEFVIIKIIIKNIYMLTIKAEVLKLLDVGIIYPIFHSSWVNLVQMVPKKGGMMVVKNENNELIPTRIVICWWVRMDYKKLNATTRKDHFPLPFID